MLDALRFAPLFAAPLVVAACSTSSSASDAGAVSDLDAACLDYPDVGQRVFPILADAAAAAYGLPRCPDSCHPQPSNAGTFPNSDQSLPSGPCSVDGERCAAAAAGWCPPCVADHAPGNGYVCQCVQGAWSCAIASQGGAACLAPTCIAGVEGGTLYCGTCGANEWCIAGECRPLCDSDKDCPTGTCHLGATCFPPPSCEGSAPCPATCRGYCR